MSIRHLTRLHRPSLLVVASAALMLLVLGDDSSAGIQGTGRSMLAYGRITAFGSIFVDGVEYAISQAQIQIDGRAAQASQLEVGQIVAVQGTQNGANKGNATQVTFTGDVVGPITQVDVAGSTFTVLGQQVAVDANTLFGDGIQPAGIGALSVGTNVEVSAFVTASGSLMASLVELQTAGTPLQVKGAVQALDTAAQTFQINDLTISYTQATLSGKLQNGRTATVWASESPSAGVLQATTILLSNGVGGASGVNGEVQGLITSLSSLTSLLGLLQGVIYVGDQPVVINTDTHLVLHGQLLALNLGVKVKGSFNASGQLVASHLDVDLGL
jgi:hypothetical protein